MVARKAGRQHGLATRAQALEAGFSEGRLRAASWDLAQRAVYRAAAAPDTWEQRLLAAVWGARGVVSHRAAAALLDLDGFRPGIVEVTTRYGRRARGMKGVIVHESRAFDHGRTVRGIPVTGGARTLIDLASVVPPILLGPALDDALRRRLVTTRSLAEKIDQIGFGRRGVLALRRELDRREGLPIVGSPLERRFVDLVEAAGLPAPRLQFEIEHQGRLIARVDFAYPHKKIAIEIDGYRWHSGRRRWELDGARQNELELLGWTVLRFSSTQLDEAIEDLRRAYLTK